MQFSQTLAVSPQMDEHVKAILTQLELVQRETEDAINSLQKQIKALSAAMERGA